MSERNYPSQYEAELVLATKEALNMLQAYSGCCTGSKCASIIKKTGEELQGEWNRVFCSPDTSPWEIKVIRKNLHISWRKGWK